MGGGGVGGIDGGGDGGGGNGGGAKGGKDGGMLGGLAQTCGLPPPKIFGWRPGLSNFRPKVAFRKPLTESMRKAAEREACFLSSDLGLGGLSAPMPNMEDATVKS